MANIKRRGIVAIPSELLFQLLGLEDAILLNIAVNHFRAGNIEMVIESPAMPECREGEHPRVFNLEEVSSAI